MKSGGRRQRCCSWTALSDDGGGRHLSADDGVSRSLGRRHACWRACPRSYASLNLSLGLQLGQSLLRNHQQLSTLTAYKHHPRGELDVMHTRLYRGVLRKPWGQHLRRQGSDPTWTYCRSPGSAAGTGSDSLLRR